jgi:hypothetical protein
MLILKLRNSRLRHVVDCGILWSKVKIKLAEQWNCRLVAMDYSENSSSGIAKLLTSGSALRKI